MSSASIKPDVGSDPDSMRTGTRRDGADWILDGRKMWITSGSVADVAIVWASTEDGVEGFVVPTTGFADTALEYTKGLGEPNLGEISRHSAREQPRVPSMKRRRLGFS